MNSTNEIRVHYIGAGWTAAPDWLNFDASPSLRLERLPVIRALLKVSAARTSEVRFGDIVAGLPVRPGTVALRLYEVTSSNT